MPETDSAWATCYCGLVPRFALIPVALTLAACPASPQPDPFTDTDWSEIAASGDGGQDATGQDASLEIRGDTDTVPDLDSGSVVDTDTDTDTVVDVDTTTIVDVDANPIIDADTSPIVDADSGPDDDADSGLEDVGPGPFDDLEGLFGDALRAALYDRIKDHTSLGYKGDGWAREYMYSSLDVHDGRIECIYTGRTVAAEDPNAPPIGDSPDLPPIDNTPETDCRFPDGTVVPDGCSFNAEHSWPKSAGATDEPALSDIHHLFPCFGDANVQRSSYPFGYTTCQDYACTWNEGGSELGKNEGGSIAFEVRPERRGDIARAQFYFAVRYDKTIQGYVENDLRAWHSEDPPDSREIGRNEAIFSVQGNRNPFVTRPDFVDAIYDF